MAGNVPEWTATVYQGQARVCRGGSWFHEDFEDVTTSRRAWNSPGFRDDAVGLRCVKSQ